MSLDYHMGEHPLHRPETMVKILYDQERLYVVVKVRDRYVKAVAQEPQGKVCRDSCVEFFFTPGDESPGYFNFELNCCGVYLFHYQIRRHVDMVLIGKPDCDRIKIAHSMAVPIVNEIQEPVEWTVEYSIPFDILHKYHTSYAPAEPGAVWRANFYKCADESSHPHWLTWSPVDFPTPDFHRPDSFGFLEFI